LEIDPNPAPTEFVGSADLGASSDDLAARARGLLGVPLELQFSWRDRQRYKPLNGWKNALESVGALVFHFTDVEPTEVRAFALAANPYPVISLNGADSPNGRIFSLAHELGHLLLGEGVACDLEDFTRLEAPPVAAETFCNRFAGSFLVPAASLLERPEVDTAGPETEWSTEDLDAIGLDYGVSREVVLRRLLTLEKTSLLHYQNTRNELLTLPFAAHDATGRPSYVQMVVRNLGKHYARLVIDAYRVDRISGADVVDFLGVKLKHLPRIEERLTGNDTLTGALP
jgi:Zn-dependent peptidase ImmA (M78 family)